MIKISNSFNKFVYIFIILLINMPIMAKDSIYQYSFQDIDGKIINLKDFEGKPIFLVNTASKCGFTPQYADLQILFQKFKTTDLIFIATPSNEFKQELSSEEEVKKFCLINYGISFSVTEIINLKGDNAHPIYKWIDQKYNEKPKWNFYKYLFNRDGELVKTWSSIIKPTSPKIVKSIEKIL